MYLEPGLNNPKLADSQSFQRDSEVACNTPGAAPSNRSIFLNKPSMAKRTTKQAKKKTIVGSKRTTKTAVVAVTPAPAPTVPPAASPSPPPSDPPAAITAPASPTSSPAAPPFHTVPVVVGRPRTPYPSVVCLVMVDNKVCCHHGTSNNIRRHCQRRHPGKEVKFAQPIESSRYKVLEDKIILIQEQIELLFKLEDTIDAIASYIKKE